MSRKFPVCLPYLVSCILIFTLIVSTLVGTKAEAWSDDPTQNTPICTASGFQERPVMVSDGSGGAIITWVDGRGSSHDIYAQRVDSTGAVQWTTNGVAICTATGTQTLPAIVEDGTGGAVITWQDQRTGGNDIYSQKVDSTGTTQWTANGTPICTEASAQQNPVIASDGSGGAIIAWRDYRSGWYDIYAQSVNSVGMTQWTINGVAICSAVLNQEDPAIISDTSGGAIITWEDARSGWTDIYVQRVDSTGTPQWTANGSAVCSAINNQVDPAIVSAGSGASIIMWQDYRSGTQWDIYARRVNANGFLAWLVDGDPMCMDDSSQQYAVIASDGLDGYVMAWQDYRTYGSTAEDIYAQRIPGMATLSWGQNGTAVCNDPEGQDYPAIIGDGSGGAIITWQDYRSDSTHDIYAQRIASSGTSQWIANGTAISIASDNQKFPIIVSDSLGGAIIAWEDSRNGNDSDIYAQRIHADGVLAPEPTPTPAPTPAPSPIPTLSQWGMIGMAIVLAAFLVWSVRRRWITSTDKS